MVETEKPIGAIINPMPTRFFCALKTKGGGGTLCLP